MLEHQKIILKKVSRNKEIFRKELIKSFKWLNQDEIKKLYKWLQETFWDMHKEIISEAFYLASA